MEDRRELYFSMLNDYHNEAVADQVKRIYEKNQIIEWKGRLYQQIDPIFMDPEPEGLGIRSHFYAPHKYFLGRYVDTYTFNIGFIWFLTLLAYLILYYQATRPIIKQQILPTTQRLITHRITYTENHYFYKYNTFSQISEP